MDVVAQMSAARSGDKQARLRSMLNEHVKFVARTLRRAGVPPSELDDEIQRTFMIAARRLDDVERATERQFLFQVALHVAAHMRRTLARRREVSGDQVPERVETLATPERLAERKRMREQVDGILDQMNASLRAVLILSAFEEMSMTEISVVLGIPRGTVASRLRRARRAFRDQAEAINLAPPGNGPTAEEEHVSWRRESWTALAQALLGAGASPPPLAATHAKTLATLGLVPAGRRRRDARRRPPRTAVG